MKGFEGPASLALAALLHATVARAQVSTEDRATAEALFREAKQLMAKRHHPDACRKFEESQRLDPQDGTLLNLAVCHAREGKTASAWTEFQMSLQRAREAKRKDRERLARREMRQLEPRLSQLTIEVPEDARVAGLSVRRGGSEIGPATWGTAVPVDPGTVVIVQSAPGHRERSLEITLDEGEAKTLSLDKLEALPAEPKAERPPEPLGKEPDAAARDAEESRQARRMWSFVAGGVGVVGVGVGAYFGLRAISKNDESNSHCKGSLCDPQGLELADEADAAATVSNVAFGVGAVGLVAGGYLFFTSSPPPKDPVVSARVGAQGASIVVKGVW
ncbi:MAG: hypothetical protein R3B13_31780 [Polyangiaceae bacterium]